MQTLGDFIKEHNAGQGFKFTVMHADKSWRQILHVGTKAVFLVDNGKYEYCFAIGTKDYWQVYTPPKTFKEVKLLAWKHRRTGTIDWKSSEEEYDTDGWTRVPESDTVAKVEVRE